MSKEREALKLALDAWEAGDGIRLGQILRSALTEQPAQQCKYPNCDYPCPDLPDCRDAEQPAIKQDLTPERPAQQQEPVKPSLWERYHEAQTTTPPAALVQLAWVWQQAPVKTQWGHDMVVADLAIDKDHTVSIYCELDQTSKVEAMFTPPAAPVQESDAMTIAYMDGYDKGNAAAQRQWVGLSDVDLADCTTEEYETALYWERVLREKNAAAQPAYDQTALELCEVCGWKTLIPGDVCLNCEHEAAAQRQSARSAWVGLTDEEISSLMRQFPDHLTWEITRAIEAKLREKNGGAA